MLTYLVGAAFFLLLWVLLYATAPRARPDMILASLGLAHFGLLLQGFYGKDYWSPEYLLAMDVGGMTMGVEDYVFGFALSGVAAGVFRLIGHAGQHVARRPFVESWMRLQVAGAAFIGLTFLLAPSTGVNSVHVTNALCVVGAVAIIIARPQWIGSSLASGALMALVLFAFYEAFYLTLYPAIFDAWWHASALSGVTLGRVPIEELAWGFAMGLFIGPVVAICRVVQASSRSTPQLRASPR